MEKYFETTLLETNIFNLTSENKHLHDFAKEVNAFFDKQASPIIAKCVANIVIEIEELGRESDLVHFLPEDYSHLTLFEQISLVAMPGDLHIYPAVVLMIRNFCENEINILDEHDKFIMSHRYRDFDEDTFCPAQELENAFVEYATNYTNEKLSEYR